MLINNNTNVSKVKVPKERVAGEKKKILGTLANTYLGRCSLSPLWAEERIAT